jgi:hypothetical protein
MNPRKKHAIKHASKAVQGIIDTNDGPREMRHIHFDNLLKAIEKDLSL